MKKQRLRTFLRGTKIVGVNEWVMPIMQDPANKWRVAPMAVGGEYGPSSRIKFAKQGAALVYGFLSSAAIEGQLSVQELRRYLAK
jgi:3-dehydroquinate dehydratase